MRIITLIIYIHKILWIPKRFARQSRINATFSQILVCSWHKIKPEAIRSRLITRSCKSVVRQEPTTCEIIQRAKAKICRWVAHAVILVAIWQRTLKVAICHRNREKMISKTWTTCNCWIANSWRRHARWSVIHTVNTYVLSSKSWANNVTYWNTTVDLSAIKAKNTATINITVRTARTTRYSQASVRPKTFTLLKPTGCTSTAWT